MTESAKNIKTSCEPSEGLVQNERVDFFLENMLKTQRARADMTVILRVETSPDDHPAEVPEAVLPPHDEERLVEVRVVLSQLLLLDLSNSSKKQAPG